MLGDKKISEIMTPAPLPSIESRLTVEDAAKLMKKTGKSSLVVLNNGKAVGIITERDIVRRVVALEVSTTTTKISGVMSTPIISVDPDDSISKVAKLMTDHGIRRVIVMKKSLIIGAASAKDFVKVIVSEGDKDVQLFKAMMRSSTARY